ncbi:MAG TPA: hypothetical protein ENL44_03650 [Thermoplasmatales archaeon]|nr:hypothetical protein [Thermoplasmatales archaeon]
MRKMGRKIRKILRTRYKKPKTNKLKTSKRYGLSREEGKMKIEEELLKGERIEKILTPHPLSFMGLQALWIFIAVFGIILWWTANYSQYTSFLESWFTVLLLWWIGIIIAGVVASLVAIRWRFFFLYVIIASLGTFLAWRLNYLVDGKGASFFILVYSLLVSIIMFIGVYVFVKSHRYVLTDCRIIFRGGVLKKRERTLRYDKITDVDGTQGILGQIFDFGTIIPITQSGFGLGSDQTFAAGGVKGGGKRFGIFGLAGGAKEVKTPRARTYYELHGVYPYKEVRKLLEELIQGHVITPYQREQVELQREQLELQKEMKELLERQKELKD